MNEDQFWAALTNKRDQALAHVTDLIARSGSDEFCGFLSKHVMPAAMDSHGEENPTEYIIAHCAVIGAVDALMAWRDAREAETAD
jgi:hypothetical protein